MAKELFNRYVWLIDTLQRYGRLTRREIDGLWQRSEYSDGKPMARRTFMNYRQAIQEMFDVNIECDASTYEYYIEDPDALQGNGARVWALNTLAVNNMLNESQELRNRIVLENIPSGQKFLRIVFEAMKENRVLILSYRSFRRVTSSHTLVAPYFVKLFRQRWYVIAKDFTDRKIKTYALDRVASLELSSRTFVYPDSFSPIDYFRDCFGITHDDMPAQEVVLRVPALQANYLRTLPLHESQEELDRNEHSSTFHYRLKSLPISNRRCMLWGIGKLRFCLRRLYAMRWLNGCPEVWRVTERRGYLAMNTGSRRYLFFPFIAEKKEPGNAAAFCSFIAR